MLNEEARPTAYNLTMQSPPAFLQPGRSELTARSYRPYPPDRKGEILAWLCTAGVLLAGALWQWKIGEMPAAIIGLTVFVGLAAILITFGNWVDRSTRIDVNPDGIKYQNGLRSLMIGWGVVRGLRAFPLRRGWRLEVENPIGRLSFRSPAELQLGSFEGMQVGIEYGDDLARDIVAGAQLARLERQDDGWYLSRSGSDRSGRSAQAELRR